MKNDEATLIVQAVLSLGRRMRAERSAHAAGLPAISLLGTLRRLGPMPAARLAHEERLQPQSLTSLIRELELKKWIERKRSEEDRREILIELTPEGRKVFAEDIGSRRAWLREAMAENLSEAERETLVEAAKAMLKLSNF